MKSSLEMVLLISVPKGMGTMLGIAMRAISTPASSQSVSFTESAWRGISGWNSVGTLSCSRIAEQEPMSSMSILKKGGGAALVGHVADDGS